MSERMDDIAMRYKAAQDALDAAMEESGGEITEENKQLVAEVEELAAIKAQIQEQFLEMPDEYGAWYKNVEAQKPDKRRRCNKCLRNRQSGIDQD